MVHGSHLIGSGNSSYDYYYYNSGSSWLYSPTGWLVIFFSSLMLLGIVSTVPYLMCIRYNSYLDDYSKKNSMNSSNSDALIDKGPLDFCRWFSRGCMKACACSESKELTP